MLSWGHALCRDSVPIHPTLVPLARSLALALLHFAELAQAACQRCCHEMALMLIRLPDLSDERGINANSNVRANKFRRFPVGNLRQTLPALVSAFLQTSESLELQFLPSMLPSRRPPILCSHLFFCRPRGRKKTNGIYFDILSCSFFLFLFNTLLQTFPYADASWCIEKKMHLIYLISVIKYH